MKFKISIIVLLLISFSFNAKSDSLDSLIISDEIEVTPQTTYLSYGTDDDNNNVYLENYSGHDLYQFNLVQIGGNLNLQYLGFRYDLADWDAHPIVPHVYILDLIGSGGEGHMEIIFELAIADQDPGDYAVVQFSRRSAVHINALWDQPWRVSTFTINVEDPPVSTTDPYCYSGRSVSVSGYPSHVTSVSWTKSSNLRFISSNTGTTVTVGAASSSTSGSGWVSPILHLASGELTCEQTTLWVGKPGQPSTNPTGVPGLSMSLYQLKTIYVGSSPGANNYLWSATGSVTRRSSQTASYMVMEATSVGSGQFYLWGTNTCGTSTLAGGGSVYVTSGGGGGPLGPLSVAPNPADSYIELTFNESKLTEAGPEMTSKMVDFGSNSFIRIVDKFGEVKLVRKYSGEKQTQISTSQLPPGLYTLQLVTNDKIYSTNIMISR